MPLFVHSLQTHVFDLSQQKIVEEVKALIAEREGLPMMDMAVFYEGQPLKDVCELATFRDESTLNVELRMLGGKVRGNLARAGKVRGQMPKVEKQDKKKRRTARAKRRMQCNRRFVNEVAAFGRKKGPYARS